MNLIDFIHRKDKRLVAGRELALRKVRWGNDIWRSVVVSKADDPQLIIGRIADVYTMRSRPVEIGWYVRSKQGQGSLLVSFVDRDVVASRRIDFAEDPVPVVLPWPIDGRGITAETRLQLTFERLSAEVELLVHRVLDRRELIALARGQGIEIGPGTNPQILPSQSVAVKYVEEMPAEKWKELYDHTGKRGAEQADWSNYIIGTASNLPVEDSSLDFIFGSHLFEHLANPLGHLMHWKKKLKPGGLVMAIVPDMNSTKDLIAEPSSVSELYHELASGIWAPTRAHYERWIKLRGPSYKVDDLMANGTSIHVHFYDRTGIANLLQSCVERQGFSAYSIVHSQNHKDFHFCLWN